MFTNRRSPNNFQIYCIYTLKLSVIFLLNLSLSYQLYAKIIFLPPITHNISPSSLHPSLKNNIKQDNLQLISQELLKLFTFITKICTNEDLFSQEEVFLLYKKLNLPITTKLSPKIITSFFQINSLTHKIIQVNIQKDNTNLFRFISDVYHIKGSFKPTSFRNEHYSLFSGISKVLQNIFPQCTPPRIESTTPKLQFFLFSDIHPKYQKSTLAVLEELQRISTEPIHTLFTSSKNSYDLIPASANLSNWFQKAIQRTSRNKRYQLSDNLNIFLQKYQHLLSKSKENTKIIPIVLVNHTPQNSEERLRLKARIRSTLYKMPVIILGSKFLSPTEADFWETAILKKSFTSQNAYFSVQYKQKIRTQNSNTIELVASISTLSLLNQEVLLNKYYITETQFPNIHMGLTPAKIYKKAIEKNNQKISFIANKEIHLKLHPNLYKIPKISNKSILYKDFSKNKDILVQVQKQHIWITLSQQESFRFNINQEYYFFTRFYQDPNYEKTILKNDPQNTKIFISPHNLPKMLFLTNNDITVLFTKEPTLWNQYYIIFKGIIKEIR